MRINHMHMNMHFIFSFAVAASFNSDKLCGVCYELAILYTNLITRITAANAAMTA